MEAFYQTALVLFRQGLFRHICLGTFLALANSFPIFAFTSVARPGIFEFSVASGHRKFAQSEFIRPNKKKITAKGPKPLVFVLCFQFLQQKHDTETAKGGFAGGPMRPLPWCSRIRIIVVCRPDAVGGQAFCLETSPQTVR